MQVLFYFKRSSHILKNHVLKINLNQHIFYLKCLILYQATLSSVQKTVLYKILKEKNILNINGMEFLKY